MTFTELPPSIDQELKIRSKQWERTNRYQLIRYRLGADDEIMGANLTAEAAKALAVKLTTYSAAANFSVKAQLPAGKPEN